MARRRSAKTLTEHAAEMGTGIVEHPHGHGTIYDTNGNKLNHEQAQDAFRDKGIEVPNAGAGSYERIFKYLGYKETKVIDWTSSAGDWTFGVCDDGYWYLVTQSNRYPHHGFRYCMDPMTSAESFEELCELAMC
jgi:hypothetical protein